MSLALSTQNDLLMSRLKMFYSEDNYGNMKRILPYINGDSSISLRLIDWFVTNYSKKNYTVYAVERNNSSVRFKVFIDYKLRLRAYGKKKFDPFCRWERIAMPYENDTKIETTIGQLNFFKWALENNIMKYIEENRREIEEDMNTRNLNVTMKNNVNSTSQVATTNKTRKKRQELSLSATKSIKKEEVEIIVRFNT
uniref:Uncharacterized protein n=1 Tax=viral metagenome TaxID=1070528 RepID=A0A6C0BTU4_9ZZZZ